MTPLHRRDFLRHSATYAAYGCLVAPWLAGLVACNGATARITAPPDEPGDPDGPDDPDGRGSYGALARHPTLPYLVPQGFQLVRLDRAGDPMPAGSGVVPNAHDGMCALRTRAGGVRLVRNHELHDGPRPDAAMGRLPYDPLAAAGCTTVEVAFDPWTHEPRVVREFVSLSGTIVNCAGGRLQMLRVVDRPRLATYRGTAGVHPLVPIAVDWVDVEHPDPALERGERRTFHQGHARGGAAFGRLEGCWWGGDACFFNATHGGAAGAGQVWQYRQTGPDAGELLLVVESPGPDVLDSPDDLCVSPHGGLVLCEDGAGVQFIRGLTRTGRLFDLVASDGDASEFAGACFSPDGRVLFFNVLGGRTSTARGRAATYALWGPWERGAL